MEKNAITAQAMIDALKLEPLPGEGGYFRQTYKANRRVVGDAGQRAALTSIYYLVTPDEFSSLHRLVHDEVFHFYVGDPVEMIQWREGEPARRFVLGHDVLRGERPQVVVEGGYWQGTRLVPGGHWALLGTDVAPGFEFADTELMTAAAFEALRVSAPAVAAPLERFLKR